MGGGTKVISIYADYLTKQGHEVLVVSLPHQHSKSKKIRDMFSFNSNLPSTQISYFDGSHIKQHVLDTNRPIVSADLPDADVVIATWWETAEWLNKVEDKKGKKVYFIQGYEVWDPIPKERSSATYHFNMQKIVVSKWLQNVLAKNHGLTNTDLVPNGVDKSFFIATDRAKQKTPTIGFLINNATVKGLDIAVKVVNELKKYYPNLRVLTFGSHKLNPLMTSLFPVDIPVWLNPTPNSIREIYLQCDVWLATGRSEGFNLTAIEAMACGTPVVSTKTGWPCHSINNYINGVLADIDDVYGLVEGAKWLLELSDTAWQTVSKHAELTTQGVDWEVSGAMFEAALKKQLSTLASTNKVIN